MKVLIILGHPTKGSFNHAIAETAKNKLEQNEHEVLYHDLYAEKFNPILTTEEIPKNAMQDSSRDQYCTELKNCDGVIIVHPNWWGQPPAIVKGWIDRIIRPGVAYVFKEKDKGEGIPIGLLKGKTALVFNTSNTNEERENNIFKDPLEAIWKNCIFDLCGIKTFYRKMFRIVVTSTENERSEWLKEVTEKVDLYFPKNVK